MNKGNTLKNGEELPISFSMLFEKDAEGYAQEDGRSIVEMIGVLGLAGLLTIGAVAGLTQAFGGTKEKKIMDEARHQGAELKLRRRVFVEDDGEIRYAYALSDKYIVSRRYGEGRKEIYLKTKPIGSSLCAKMHTTRRREIFSSIICEEDALTFIVPVDGRLINPTRNDYCAGRTCSGHGYCENGVCHCDEGWQGENCGNFDCSTVQMTASCALLKNEHDGYGCLVKKKLDCMDGVQYCAEDGTCQTCDNEIVSSCSINSSEYLSNGCLSKEKIDCEFDEFCNTSGTCESCPEAQSCYAGECCEQTGTDACGNPTYEYGQMKTYLVNNANGCLVEQSVCSLDNPNPVNETQRCDGECQSDGTCKVLTCPGFSADDCTLDCKLEGGVEKYTYAPSGTVCEGEEGITGMCNASGECEECYIPGCSEGSEYVSNGVCMCGTCEPIANCSIGVQPVENSPNCTCPKCDEGYILKNDQCSACNTIEHCAGYSTPTNLGCVCMTCEDGYTLSYGSTSALNKCVSDADKVTCSSGGKTWYCSADGELLPPVAEGDNGGMTCGSSVGSCCYNGICCDEDEYLNTTNGSDILCCPLGVLSWAWDFNTGSKRCCDIGNTETTVKSPSGWNYCCPAGSTAIQNGECVEKCTNVEHCATYNTFCACQTCESGYQLNASTGLCEDARCGTTPSTCTADCPTSCTVPSSVDPQPLIGRTEWAGYTCAGGKCYCDTGKGASPTEFNAEMCEQIEQRFSSLGFGVEFYDPDGNGVGPCHVYFDQKDFDTYPRNLSPQCAWCVVEGTQITLADGTTKNVEDIDYSDNLKVWDFDEGQFAQANPLFIKLEEEIDEYSVLKFDDGSELKNVEHRIFNIQAGKFTYPMTDDTPIGTKTFNADGKEITLVSKEVVKGVVKYYNIITKRHLNCFANGILTSCRLNNMYPIENMKFVKDDRRLIEPSECPLIPQEWFDGLRLAEQPQDINRDGAVNFNDTSVQDYALRIMKMDKRLNEMKKVA